MLSLALSMSYCMFSIVFNPTRGGVVVDPTHRSFYTKHFFTDRSFAHSKLLHTASVHTGKLLNREAFAQRSFYTQQTLAHRSLDTESKWPVFTVLPCPSLRAASTAASRHVTYRTYRYILVLETTDSLPQYLCHYITL